MDAAPFFRCHFLAIFRNLEKRFGILRGKSGEWRGHVLKNLEERCRDCPENLGYFWYLFGHLNPGDFEFGDRFARPKTRLYRKIAKKFQFKNYHTTIQRRQIFLKKSLTTGQ